jgi:hypothetical protein
MESFHLWWLIFAALMLVAAALAGKRSTANSVLGILIDARGRYSLNRVQLVTWNLLILSTFLALVFSVGNVPDIPQTLVGLLGISLGSGVIAGAVKAGKDQDANAKVGKDGMDVKSDNGAVTHTIHQRPMQMVMAEEGPNADKIVDVGKFQNAVFTVGLAVTYIALTWTTGKFPEFNTQALMLLGLSHAGYVGGKIPNQGGN